MTTPQILSAKEIGIDKKDISANALKVIKSLQEAGYSAYLVGGCVRDLLLDMKPKDFDVSTNATPEQVKAAIKGSRIIGRRFRLVHVRFGYEVIEVATFRAHANDRESVEKQEMSEGKEGQLLRDNVYGTIEEDVMRRDFKANALYYDPISDEVLDFVDGLDDIKAKRMCSIGEAQLRFREDPVRMLRVIRFAGKLGFSMEDEALTMIEQEGNLLSNVSPARLFDEVLKLFHGGSAYETYLLLRKYGLFKYLFPFTDQSIVDGDEGMPEKALKNTDKRVRAGKPVIPAFLFASMMWDPIKADAQILMNDRMSENQAWKIAMNDGLRDQNQYVAVPRRLAEIIIDIWEIHFRLIKRNPRMVKSSLNNRRFRAAYDFLLLRSSLHEVDDDLAQWWTDIQEVDAKSQDEMIVEIGESYKNQRQKRYNKYDEEGEADGNSINYNKSEPDFNSVQPANKNNRTNPSRSREGQGRNRGRVNNNRRNRNTGSRGNNANSNNNHANSSAGNENGGQAGTNNSRSNQLRSNRRRSNTNKSNSNRPSNRRNNNRNSISQSNRSSSSNRFENSRPRDEYGNHQIASEEGTERKVKIRHKRKIIPRGVKKDDESPIF